MNAMQCEHLKSVAQIYDSVIDDVINNVSPFLEDENVDPTVLKDLKQMWVKKVRESGAVPFFGMSDKKTALQIRISRNDNTVRPSIPILVPLYAKDRMSGELREQIIRLGEIIRADNIPDNKAKVFIEDQLEELFPQLDGHFDSSSDSDSDSAPSAAKRTRVEPPTNGQPSSSSSENEEEEEEEREVEDTGERMSPLNSEDDLSLDLTSVFETDNIVCCQYSSVEEKKKSHEWHIKLTRGVMNLDGTDYVFNTLQGVAPWV